MPRALRGARSQILNDFIPWISGINLTVGAANEMLVGADIAEMLSIKRRFGPLYLEARNFGRGSARTTK
jgi:hypothetical protein